jgi:hypothetical protein
MTRVDAVLARAILLVIGILLFVVVGEVALRVIYRDAGKSTLSGPGGRSFDYQTIDGLKRGRLDTGPKTPGVPRVMVVGDSITYGLGVRDWRGTWPERVAQSLERAGRPHQFAVLAEPGNDMPQLLDTMRHWVERVQPDVLIYQWYVNDIEAMSHRPNRERPWQRLPWHRPLQSSSYLYYVLDHRFAQLLLRPHLSYVNYLRDFIPGSFEWTEFEKEFHEFAVRARRAPCRILMLYPQVPFRGVYPLQILHDRMRALAGPHELEIPPLAWTRTGAVAVPLPGSRWEHAMQGRPELGVLRVQTSEYVFAPGVHDVILTIAGAPARLSLGVLEAVDVTRNTVVSAATVDSGSGENISTQRVRLRLPGDSARRLALRVTASSPGSWALANIALQVDYGFQVIDLTEALNTFNTHASSFDAHPNERAHQVMADAVLAAMSSEAR